jgi:hypothetical protein
MFVDTTTKACVSTCAIPDPTNTICYNSIDLCVGFVSLDKTECATSCAPGETITVDPIKKQSICSIGCQNGGINIQGFCVGKCLKGTFLDVLTNTCLDKSKCQKVISFDGFSCDDECEPG